MSSWKRPLQRPLRATKRYSLPWCRPAMCDLSILRGLQGRDVPFVGCVTDVEIDFWNQSPIGSSRIHCPRRRPEDPESGGQLAEKSTGFCGIIAARVTIFTSSFRSSLIPHRLLPIIICGCTLYYFTLYHEPECEFVRTIRKLIFSRRKRTTLTRFSRATNYALEQRLHLPTILVTHLTNPRRRALGVHHGSPLSRLPGR